MMTYLETQEGSRFPISHKHITYFCRDDETEKIVLDQCFDSILARCVPRLDGCCYMLTPTVLGEVLVNDTLVDGHLLVDGDQIEINGTKFHFVNKQSNRIKVPFPS